MATKTSTNPEDPSDPKKSASDNNSAATPTKTGEAKSPSSKEETSESSSKKEKFKPKVDVATRKRAVEKALKRSQKSRRPGDTLNFSSRIRESGMAAYELIKAKHPELNNTDLLTYIMLLGAELVETSPRPKFGTLDDNKYTLIKGDLATLIIELYKFEEDLLGIDLYPDDPERTEKIANLAEATQDKIERIETLGERIAQIAMLSEIPKDPNELRLLEKLAGKLEGIEEGATAKEKPMWTLARKLLGPYLP